MMAYKFGGLGFDDRETAITAMVVDFLTAGGLNDPDEIAERLSDPSFREECASEMLSDWDCNISASSEELDIPDHDELVAAIQNVNIGDLA